jgi:putative membrane protein
MMRFILQAVFAGVGLWLASILLHGVRFSSTESLLAAAVLLGLANAIVRPIMVVLTLPLTLLTLGLFLLVINGIMVWLVAALLRGFSVHGLWSAMLAAIIVSVVSWIGGNLIRDKRRR